MRLFRFLLPLKLPSVRFSRHPQVKEYSLGYSLVQNVQRVHSRLVHNSDFRENEVELENESIKLEFNHRARDILYKSNTTSVQLKALLQAGSVQEVIKR